MIRLWGSVKLNWAFGSGVGSGRVGSLPRGFFSLVPLLFAGGDFGFVLGLLGGGHLAGPFFDDLPGLLQSRHPLLPARQFGGKVQRLLGFPGLGLLGPLDELGHFQFQLRDHLPGPWVAHGGVFAGVGLNLGPIHADRAHVGQAQVLGQLQHADKRRPERGGVGRAEGADGIMIRMGVGAEVTHGHVAVSGRLDGAGAKAAGGVTIDEQRQHHGRGILFAARAAMIDVELAQGECVDGLQDEVNDVLGGHPVAQIAGQQQRGLAVEINKTCGHVDRIPVPSVLFKTFSNCFAGLSPTGC
jgi:hypothetical protein